VGRGWRFSLFILAYARQVIKALQSGGSPERIAKLAEGYDHHDAFHAGRYVI